MAPPTAGTKAMDEFVTDTAQHLDDPSRRSRAPREGNSPSHRQRRRIIHRIATRTLPPVVFAVLLVLSSVLTARPARANNTFDAFIVLYNTTNYSLTGITGNLDWGGGDFWAGQNGSHWVQPAQQCQSGGSVVPNQPDGSPPSVLGPGQSICVQSESNGGSFPSGTGGNINIPDAGSFSWSVPFLDTSYFVPADCSSNVSPIQGSAFAGSTLSGGYEGTLSGGGVLQSKGCPFSFGLKQTGPASFSKPTNQLGPLQALSRAAGHNSITNKGPNGNTYTMVLGDNGDLVVLQSQFPGAPAVLPAWSTGPSNAEIAMMEPNGAFVLLDSANNIGWSSNTGCPPFDIQCFGHPPNAGAVMVPAGRDLVGDTLVPAILPAKPGPPVWSGKSCNNICSPG
jgi:hypothetical protein